MSEPAWWKEAVIYEIYPRSFKDSNGDGMGDIRGIISKLDYIKSLGINVVWLTPIYASPNDDNGYDISNYESILPGFGTMADFNVLLNGLHERGIRLVLDLVVNHTSDEHPWFIESRKSGDNPYRDYYHWWPAEKGKPAHRFSFFDPRGEGWTYDAGTDAYYLHYFSRKQPDLNWENPKVRQQIYQVMRFWLEKGVDGFRLDALTYISKDTRFPEIQPDALNGKYRHDWSYYYSKGPSLHDHLKELNREVFSQYDMTTIAETPGISREQAPDFVHEDRKELHMVYHFEGLGLGLLPEGFKRPDPDGYKLPAFKKLYSDWDAIFVNGGWGTIYLGNHDQPRIVTRWGNDAPEFRIPSTKMLLTFLLTMRATPIIYNGDELGMTNIKFDNIHDYRDIETLSMYQYLKNKGEDVQQFVEDQKTGARDNSRTPFQWHGGLHAGFTTGEPWIKINPNHVFINQESQEADPFSILHYFRRLVQLRNERKVLVYGKYTLYDEAHEQVYCYTRSREQEGILVLLNFSDKPAAYTLPEPVRLKNNCPLLNNENALLLTGRNMVLLPYQALLFECES
jgi:oligo-1,6-glucosidase